MLNNSINSVSVFNMIKENSNMNFPFAQHVQHYLIMNKIAPRDMSLSMCMKNGFISIQKVFGS